MSKELELRVRELLTAQKLDEAVTLIVQTLGPELMGFIVSLERDYDAASDVFSRAVEDVWRGLTGFRWESSLRTWLYAIARNAAHRRREGWYDRARQPLSQAKDWAVAEARVRTETQTFLKTQSRDAIRELRSELSLDEQTLLVLRVDRGMPWRDIAVVLQPPETPIDEALLERTGSGLRKRFERIKERLRELARQRGLVKTDD
jgi:RNA polymerase sigma-70 factor (ECF subfamily)